MSKKQTLTLYCGVSASGKSTNVEELRKSGWKFVELNRDEWRFKLFVEGEPSWAKYKFSKERENTVTEKLNELFEHAVANLLPVIVSNTNLNKKDHLYWENKAKEVGYNFEVKYFPVTLTEALKRDKKRGALAVGQDVLFDQWQKWLEITNARKYVPDTSKPKAVLVDLDGTLAINTHRDIHDYSEKVKTDTVRWDVVTLMEQFALYHGAHIIALSGRDGVCYTYTKEWLEEHAIMFDSLYMRKEGDRRCDTIIKEEIFWEHIAPSYNVLAIFEDRPKMVRHWKFLGLQLVIDVSIGVKDF